VSKILISMLERRDLFIIHGYDVDDDDSGIMSVRGQLVDTQIYLSL
jgi:hypothetical protein